MQSVKAGRQYALIACFDDAPVAHRDLQRKKCELGPAELRKTGRKERRLGRRGKETNSYECVLVERDE